MREGGGVFTNRSGDAWGAATFALGPRTTDNAPQSGRPQHTTEPPLTRPNERKRSTIPRLHTHTHTVEGGGGQPHTTHTHKHGCRGECARQTVHSLPVALQLLFRMRGPRESVAVETFVRRQHLPFRFSKNTQRPSAGDTSSDSGTGSDSHRAEISKLVDAHC